jgi:hypothetical protein
LGIVSGLKVEYTVPGGREFTPKADKRDVERARGRALKKRREALKGLVGDEEVEIEVIAGAIGFVDVECCCFLIVEVKGEADPVFGDHRAKEAFGLAGPWVV